MGWGRLWVQGRRQVTEWPLHPPQPQDRWASSRGPGRRAGEGQQGAESLGWGAQGLVNIDHSQMGMGVGEGSPYTSSQV